MSGNLTNGFTAGAGLRVGYELRLLRHLGAETGFTEVWPTAVDSCIGRPTCITSRQFVKLLDYGLRGVAPLAGGRLELSIGTGGAYVWNQWKTFNNGALFQYSGKASFARNRRSRVRVDFTLRLWRAIHTFFQHLGFLFSFKGLFAFKAKFATTWEPRYVVYRSALELPRLGLALRRVSEIS